MRLFRAVDSLNVKSLYPSNLYQYLGNKFVDWLNQETPQVVQRDLYVSERMGRGGVTEDDLVHYYKSDERRLLVLHGPAGVGKTTFIHHCLGMLRAEIPHLLHVDLLGDVDDQTAVDSAMQVVFARLSSLMCELLSSISPEPTWRRQIAEWLPVAVGRAMLLELLDSDSPVARAEAFRFMTNVAERTPLLWLRLQVTWLKQQTDHPVLLVFDNLDQASPEVVKEVVALGFKLACGARDGGDHEAVKQHGWAKTIVALRRTSLTSVSAAEQPPGYLGIRYGEVRPIDLAKALKMRIACFHRETQQRIQEDDETLNSVLASFDSANDGSSSLFGVLYELTNYNTRLSLSALAQAICSGHMEADASRADAAEFTRWRAQRALYVGWMPNYGIKSNWLSNLLGDPQKDQVSALIRIRLLRLVEMETSQIPQERQRLTGLLRDLFDYPPSRIDAAWKHLHDRGLIERLEQDNIYRMTNGGHRLLASMSGEIEYLHCISVDVALPKQFLVSQTLLHEPLTTRIRRLLNVIRYIRTREAAELRQMCERGTLNMYMSIYGESTVSQTMASCVDAWLRKLDTKDRRQRLPKEVWQLAEQAPGLQAHCALSAIRAEIES